MRSPRRPSSDVTKTWYPLGYNIRPKRLQSDRARSRRQVRRPAAGGRRDAAVVQGHRRLHGRRDSQLRVRRARGHSRHQRRACPVPRVRRQGRSEEPRDEAPSVGACRQTLVPVRHVFDFNQALMDFGAMVCVARKPKCLVCPMARSCRAFPLTSEHDARSSSRPPSSSATTVLSSRDGQRHPPRRLLGVSRRQVRAGRRSREACLARELREELGRRCARRRRKSSRHAHAYADRTVELHFFAASLPASPVPQLGQEMRWVARDDWLADVAARGRSELIRSADGGPDGQVGTYVRRRRTGAPSTTAAAPSTDDSRARRHEIALQVRERNRLAERGRPDARW